jgi:hypothetical protein
MTTTGVHSFDFLFGSWNVHNRKLVDHTDPKCDHWVEFEATSEVVPVLEGSGNIDRFFVPESSELHAFEGLTLRLFNPSTDAWRIWWSSTRAPGVLDPPVEGRFVGDHGVFECQDVIGGVTVDVRFEWLADATSPRWQQSFSWDAGRSWKLNWIMRFSPNDEAAGSPK